MNIIDAEKRINAHIVYFYNNIALGGESVIDNESVENLYNRLKELNEFDTLNLVLETSGGNLAAGTRLIHIIRKIYKNFYVTVLNRVNSTGSLLAFSSDKLFLTPKTVITPFEPQIELDNEKISVSVIRNILENINPNFLYNNIDLITLGKYYASINYFKDLVSSIFTKEQAKQIIEYMLKKVNSHQYPITNEELKYNGVNYELLDDELSKYYFDEERKLKSLFEDFREDDIVESHSTIIKDRNSSLAYTKTYKIAGDGYKKIFQGYKSL